VFLVSPASQQNKQLRGSLTPEGEPYTPVSLSNDGVGINRTERWCQREKNGGK